MDVYRYFIVDALFMALKMNKRQYSNGIRGEGGAVSRFVQNSFYVHVPLMVLRGGSVLS